MEQANVSISKMEGTFPMILCRTSGSMQQLSVSSYWELRKIQSLKTTSAYIVVNYLTTNINLTILCSFSRRVYPVQLTIQLQENVCEPLGITWISALITHYMWSDLHLSNLIIDIHILLKLITQNQLHFSCLY